MAGVMTSVSGGGTSPAQRASDARRAPGELAAGGGRDRSLGGRHVARRAAAGLPVRDRHRPRRGAGGRLVRLHHRLARVDPRPRPDRLLRAVRGDRARDGGVDPADRVARGTGRRDRAAVGEPADRRVRVRRGDAGRRRLRLGHALQGRARQRLLARGAAGLRLRQLPRRGAPRLVAGAGQPAAGVAAREARRGCPRCCCSSRRSACWRSTSGSSAARAPTRAGRAARSTSARS